jgi:hypothetical protein
MKFVLPMPNLEDDWRTRFNTNCRVTICLAWPFEGTLFLRALGGSFVPCEMEDHRGKWIF